MDMRKLVGWNVKRIRQEKGLTQEQLAELSGFSQQYISGLEQGRRNPTVVSLYELATALGASPHGARSAYRGSVASLSGRPAGRSSNGWLVAKSADEYQEERGQD
jgi:transcriptional regulator with XRE-family HTH domain